MGNFLYNEPFKERKIENLDEHMNKFINKYLRNYSERHMLSNSATWNEIYPLIDFNSKVFTRIKQLDPGIHILDASFCQDKIIFGNTLAENDPIKILEYWYEVGVFDKLTKLYEKNNMDLDFSAMHCANDNNITRIGCDGCDGCDSCDGCDGCDSYTSSSIKHDWTKLIIPFKNDKSMYLCISA